MKVPVLIPRIFNHPHTYLSGKFGSLKPGTIVTVPFGAETEIGVVWDKEEETTRDTTTLDTLHRNKRRNTDNQERNHPCWTRI